MDALTRCEIKSQKLDLLDLVDGFDDLCKRMVKVRKSLKNMKVMMLRIKNRFSTTYNDEKTAPQLLGNDDAKEQSFQGIDRKLDSTNTDHETNYEAVEIELEKVKNISEYIEKCRMMCKVYRTRLKEQIFKAESSVKIQTELLSLLDELKINVFRSSESIIMKHHEVMDMEHVENTLEFMILQPYQISGKNEERNSLLFHETEKNNKLMNMELNSTVNDEFREFDVINFEEKIKFLKIVSREVNEDLSYLAELNLKLQVELLLRNINQNHS